jgi:hypothetical protein
VRLVQPNGVAEDRSRAEAYFAVAAGARGVLCGVEERAPDAAATRLAGDEELRDPRDPWIAVWAHAHDADGAAVELGHEIVVLGARAEPSDVGVAALPIELYPVLGEGGGDDALGDGCVVRRRAPNGQRRHISTQASA